MKTTSALLSLLIWASVIPNVFAASNNSASATGVQGYDLVSYHNGKRPSAVTDTF
jgi:hypothetical protein